MSGRRLADACPRAYGAAVEDGPVNVDGIRRMLNVSREEMSDHDIRRALAILAADYNPEGMPEDVAKGARRFAEAIDRARPI
jgi:hypothetical protein